MTEEELRRRLDGRLPSADTCFFTLILPMYSSVDVMRERIRQAISLGSWRMDGDNVQMGQGGVARHVDEGARGQLPIRRGFE